MSKTKKHKKAKQHTHAAHAQQQLAHTTLPNGRQEWRVNGWLHREDGPAVIAANGAQYYYQNGELHREDGPAIIYATGRKEYYLHGLKHREDGPAVIPADPTQQGKAYIDGWQLDPLDAFNRGINLYKRD